MFEKPPAILKKLYPSLYWDINTNEKEVFLTFDDGPHPIITPKVLDILDVYKAKAVFFCVGDNVNKYPDTYKQIIDRGHRTGNHSYNHLNGWKTKDQEYFSNIHKTAEIVNSKLFRPPYGRISSTQIKHLKNEFKIIMWSVLTCDYDKNITNNQCFNYSIKNTVSGSIVVFHDSEKSEKNMMYALPKFLDYFTSRGYKFNPII